MIDSHVHLDFPAFDEDRDAVVARAKAAGVVGFVIPGVTPEQWARAQAVAEALPKAVFGVGLHPGFLASTSEGRRGQLEAFDAALDGGAAFVGECGLDRRLSEAGQEEALLHQLRQAKQRELPVVLHGVRRHGRLLEMLRPFAPLRGMVHGFAGALEVAEAYTKLGLMLGFGAAGLRSKHRQRWAVLPEDALLFETDAPDQSPVPRERNESARLPGIIDGYAQAWGCNAQELRARSVANGRALWPALGAP